MMSDEIYILPIIKKSFKWLFEDPIFPLLYLYPLSILVIQSLHMKIALGSTIFGDPSIGQNFQFFDLLIPYGAWMIFYTAIASILTLIVWTVVIRKVKVKLEGGEIKLKKAFKQGISQVPSLLGSYLLLMLLLFGPYAGFIGLIFLNIGVSSGVSLGLIIGVLGTLIWILPMIYWGVRLSLFAPACVIEDLGPIDSLKKSWRVTADNFWLTFALFLLFSLLIWVVTFPLSFLQISGIWISTLITSSFSMLIYAPALSIGVTLYYLSLSEGKNFY